MSRESGSGQRMVNGHLFFVLSVQPFNFIGRGRKSVQDNGGFKKPFPPKAVSEEWVENLGRSRVWLTVTRVLCFLSNRGINRLREKSRAG